jgi:preprotein translocase subunit SecD
VLRVETDVALKLLGVAEPGIAQQGDAGDRILVQLPGIDVKNAIDIGVDSNVLIFERIKEELEDGRSARASVKAGFSRVFLTLLDTHIAALMGSTRLSI